MSLYKRIAEAWKTGGMRARMIDWRKEPSTIRIPKPTRLDRARELGYTAKPGVIVVRQRVIRGGRQRPDIKGGRRSKHARQRKILGMSYQHVAERRAAGKFPNMEVLNSYFVGKDGIHFWYEVIMADKMHPALASDKQLSWLIGHQNRVMRGLTSAAKKSRGLRNKGFGAEKLRPSMRAHQRKGK
ncbi:50S ribosomal protein L15e [Candidatus Woesearchaeota archaeon]|nr:50S ribosomal protein L15e [Candidatus Woesearchaeota archaeon]